MHSHANINSNVKLTALMHGRRAGDVVVTALPCPDGYGSVVMNAEFSLV